MRYNDKEIKVRFRGKTYKFEFENDAKNTRNGFKHETTMYSPFGRYFGKVNYINRTWEVYPFQTSMRNVLSDAMEQRRKELISEFKRTNNIKRIMKKSQWAKLLDDFINQDTQYKVFKKVYEKI